MVEVAGGSVSRVIGTDRTLRTFEIAPFHIDRTPVTTEQYAACKASGACALTPFPATKAECVSHTNQDDPDPQRCVDLFDALAYCQWAGKQLPTSDQWLLVEAAGLKDLLPTGKSEEWAISSTCPPEVRDCTPWVDWSIDARPEVLPRAETASARGSTGVGWTWTHASDTIGFRCMKPRGKTPSLGWIEDPYVRHPGPCSASVVTAAAPRPWLIDERRRYAYSKEGELARVIVHAFGRERQVLTTPTQRLPYTPGHLRLDEEPWAMRATDASGRVLGRWQVLEGEPRQELFGYDIAGNLRWQVERGAESTYAVYHYDCWDPSAIDCPPNAPEGTVTPDLGFPACIPGDHGRWELAFENLEVEFPSDDAETSDRPATGHVHLRYVPKRGAPAMGPPQELDLADPIVVFIIEPVLTHDFDGDGHEELAVRYTAGAGEEPSIWLEVWTWKADEGVLLYEPATQARDPKDLWDVDADGIPDLEDEGRLTIPNPIIMGDECHGGIPTIYRGQPDGDLRAWDPAMLPYYQDECPRRERTRKRLFPQRREKEARDRGALKTIACQYLWGADVADLRERLETQWPTLGCDDPSELGCICDLEAYRKFIHDLPADAFRLDRKPREVVPAVQRDVATPLAVDATPPPEP